MSGQEEYSHEKGANPGVTERGDAEQPPGKWQEAERKDR